MALTMVLSIRARRSPGRRLWRHNLLPTAALAQVQGFLNGQRTHVPVVSLVD